MLDERHLQHQITEEQRNSLNEDGYFTVENALPLDLVKRLEARVDHIYQNHLDAGYDPYTKAQMTEHSNFFYPNFLGTDQIFVNILDWYKTFPKVWGILGWKHLFLPQPFHYHTAASGGSSWHA